MTLYSKPLGAANSTIAFPETTIYTVPVGGGPAILKKLALFITPGQSLVAGAHIGGVQVVLANLDNSAGATNAFDSAYVDQVLEIGDSVWYWASGGSFTVSGSGYQFQTP